MSDPDARSDATLADHVTETVDLIAAFHEAHAENATPLQKVMEAMTGQLGRPPLVAGVITAIAAWVGATLALGSQDISQPSFTWLELLATIFALLVALLILVTQRRQDQLSERRSQLTLELAMVADRKTAKLIALLQEFRHDHPDLLNREDEESRDLAKPTDPAKLLKAIESHPGMADNTPREKK